MVKQFCRNELCILPSITSHLAKYPCKTVRGYSSISLVFMCDRDTMRLSKSPSVTDYLQRCALPASAYACTPSPQ